MRVIGVIPSRWGSTRFPGKSLFRLCGKPLVQWTVEAATRAKLLDTVIVATDDERIAEAVRAFGGTAVMTRVDHPSGTDRAAEAAAAADEDIVVNIQGDEPLIRPELIDALVMRLRNGSGWEMATAAAPIRSARELDARTVVKMAVARDGTALYFSRLPIPYRREGPADLSGGLYLRHVGIYAYRGAFLKRLVREPPCALEMTEQLEQLRALYIGGRIAVIQTEDAGVGVDTPEDAKAVECLLKERAAARRGEKT